MSSWRGRYAFERAQTQARPGNRLRAAPGTLTERIQPRDQGRGPAIPGDDLKERPSAVLHRIAEQAARDAATQENVGIGDFRVDTDNQPVAEIAHQARALAGDWPNL